MSSWNPALPADVSKIRLSAGYIRGNETAVQSVISMSSLIGGYPYIPTDGTTGIYFYTAAAPSGWTLLNTVSDCLLGIQGGTSQYATAGGTVVGSWNTPQATFSGGASPGLASGINFAHTHYWTTTRLTAAVGILCTKNT